ncbi:MAG: hypothetical protein HDT43_07685 [Ruminococcaceae bacterium]|nr:hypothetical protein [Oscillospiraceae bacterium]
MTIEKAIALMKNEVACIERANNCDRDCEKCELVREDTELLTAYSMAIAALERTASASWVWSDNAIDWNIGAYVCSACGSRNENLLQGVNPYSCSGSKFCPQCGKEMHGKDNKE